MRRAHLALGILAVIGFLITGQYMDRVLGHLHGMPDGPRLLYRSRHIYILLAALVNLSLGASLRPHAARRHRTAQWIGSTLIAAATLLFVAAFILEPRLPLIQTPYAPWAIDAIAAGVVLHVIASGVAPR